MAVYSPWTYGSNSILVDLDGQDRVKLYELLLPQIIEEDQKTGHLVYLDHWDGAYESAISPWDETENIDAIWDRTGYKPVYESLFWVIEEESGVELQELKGLKDLRDPNTCPAVYLPVMAESLGHPMEENLDEQEQREVVKSIIHFNKIRGQHISWVTFYRIAGYKIIPWPLWKKAVHEADDRYNRERYAAPVSYTETIWDPGIPLGPNPLANTPVRPTSVLMSDTVETFRDDGEGTLLGSAGGFGTIDYLTGKWTITFGAGSITGSLSATYDQVTDEYPYHAARVDLDFYIVPIAGPPAPIVDPTFVNNMLAKLEEVRPIHVLLRHFTLIYEDEDEVVNFATDGILCGAHMGEDTIGDEINFYAGDAGPEAGNDILEIDKLGLTPEEKEVLMEDLTTFTHPALDVLTISSTPPQPHDGQW
jgi:hypothetical protein